MRRDADRPLRHRKARDRAAILLLIGAAFFLPPFAAMFHMDADILGIPLPVLGIFGVWLVLIVGAAVLAPRLIEADRAADMAAHHGTGQAEDHGSDAGWPDD